MKKEDFIDFIEKSRKLYKKEELEKLICNKFCIKPYEFNSIYNSLDSNGLILKNKKGQVISAVKNKIYKGKIIGHERGFGFCVVAGHPDFFIAPRNLNGALNGDIVLIKEISSSKDGQSTEAQVIKIVEKNNSSIVGTFFVDKKQNFVKPNNNRINGIILVGKNYMAKNGDNVVVKVDYNKKQLTGEIVEILGSSENLNALELSIIREHKLYEIFPETVIKEADKIPARVLENDIKKRKDLRNQIIFTIDGEDARDFDDAISIEKVGKIYKLGVHIADVSHYIKEGSELDNEAYIRSTSVYFPNMVLPMLPKKLSNGICSLNEGVDRLTLSVLMDIDENGKVLKHKIVESVINSKARLTYTDVYAVICGDKEKTEKYSRLVDKFFLMNELSKILENKRTLRGALDLDVPECEFELNSDLDVIAVNKRERNDAHKLIESFMVLCNEVVAQHFQTLESPFIYRVHEKPVIEKTKAVKEYMEGIGIQVPPLPAKIDVHYYQDLLNCTNHLPDLKQSLNKVILRSMQKAKYYPECLGHFGLGATYYCHFTSPIRRYPDLAIHRIIKEHLANGTLSQRRKIQLEDFAIEVSERSSLMERNADEAERDVDDLLKCIYIKKFIGEEFEGIISSVTNFGIFVELSNSIEGLIRIENLPRDAYLYFEKSLKLSGRQHSFSLGQRVKIKVVSSNLYERKIDFELVL